MAKRRPLLEPLEDRLCLASPSLQTTISLPSTGSWTSSAYRASPIFYDIFGTGKADLITVAAGAKLIAYAENPDGTASPVVTYQVPGGVADIKSTPIVVTNPVTGQKDLFAAMGRDETNPGSLEDGRVFGWDLQTGNLLPGWTSGQSTGHNVTGYSGVYGALTSGDLENNGMPDIVVTSFSHNVTAFRLDGSTIWQWTNDDTILSGAVIGDIDRDGQNEVVVGGDSSNSSFYQAGGWVNVLSNTGILKWRKFIPGEVTWSSPVLADLNNNGYLDIVIGTGLNFQNENIQTPGSYPNAQVQGDTIYAIDPFGNTLPGWPYATTYPTNTVAHEILAAPAVADLLGNGQLDVIAIDRAGYLHVIQPNGQDLPGFVGGKPIAPELSVVSDDYASPIVADVNGDGKPDIIVAADPFVRAFDTSGNLISIATTITPPGSTPEGLDTAAAVGNFNGTPGSLDLAFVSFNPTAQNRPDQVAIYRLPASSLTPPWPLLRRTAAGDAVERSTAFDQHFVETAFNTVLGYIPAQNVLQPYVNVLNADNLSLLGTAELITSSQLAVTGQIQRFYVKFLGLTADPGGITFWSNFLTTHTYAQMEIQLAEGSVFAQRANYSNAQEVVQLYQAILGRTPAPSEVNGYLAINQPIGFIAASMLNSQEKINDQLNALYPPAFGPGTQNSIPADAVAAYAYDIHHGLREQNIFAGVLTSGGEYAATNFVAGYVEDIYRDVLKRDASPGEVANWVTAVDNGSIAYTGIASVILNSAEARADYIQAEYQALLGHLADPATVSSLQNYANRESIVIFLVGSAEYYSRNGGTNSSFVTAAFRDLAGISIDPTNLAAFVKKMNAGLSTTGVAQQIIYGGNLYFTNTIVNELETYLPDETLGVLRSGNLPPNAAGQPINPDPNLINYCLGLQGQGFTDEQVINVLLTSPQYLSRVAYYKGILRSPGVRN